MHRIFLIIFGLLAWAVAIADVLPPQALGLEERFRNYPGTFDRYDQWCDGRRVNDDCLIPGSPVEGGGEGTCQRLVQTGGSQIDLLCVRKLRLDIERDLPRDSWGADAALCENAKSSDSMAQILKGLGWLCGERPVVADKYCRGRQVGQQCTLNYSLDGQEKTFSGICRRDLEFQSSYYQGRRTLTRVTLMCEAAQPTPALVLKPLSAWRKLVQ